MAEPDPEALGELAAVDNLPPDLLAPPRARITIGGPRPDDATTDYRPDAFEAAAEVARRRYPNVPLAVLPESSTEGPLQAVTSLGRGLAAAPGNVGRVAETAMGRLADPNFYATQPPPAVTSGGMQAPPYVAPGQGSLAARIGGTIIGAPLKATIDRVMLPGKAISGEFNPFEQDSESADWAAETAMGMIARGVAGGAPAGALGATGGRMVQPTFEAPGVMGEIAAPAPRAPRALTPRNINKFTRGEAQRVAFPGVYQRPDVIAAQAAANVAPEHPAMKALFGVTRDDLYNIGQQGRRPGNMAPSIAAVADPKGSYAAEAIMNPRNARRMVDTLSEAGKYPALTKRHG